MGVPTEGSWRSGEKHQTKESVNNEISLLKSLFHCCTLIWPTHNPDHAPLFFPLHPMFRINTYSIHRNKGQKMSLALGLLLTLLPLSAAAFSLEEAVDYALRNNPSILSAIADQEALKERVNQTRGNYLPRLDLRGEMGPEYTDKSGQNDVNLSTHDYGISLTQTLYDGGATSNVVDQNDALYRAARYRALELQSRIALNSIESYLELYRLRTLIPLLEESKDLHQNFHMEAAEKLRGGGGSKSEVTQMKAALISARNRMITTQGKVIDAMARYQRIIGIEPEGLVLPETPLQSALPPDLQEAIYTAHESHPLILSMDSTLKAAREEKEGIYASLLPSLDLELQASDTKNSGGTVKTESNWSALFKVNYNLFRGGSDRSRIRESARKLIKAEEDLRQTREQLDEKLRIAWNALNLSFQRLDIQRQQFANAQEQLEESREQFQLGNSTKLEILAAENQLLQARIGIINEEITQHLNHYRLLNHTGTLLTLFPSISGETKSDASAVLHSAKLEKLKEHEQLDRNDLERIINQISSGYDIPLWSAPEPIDHEGTPPNTESFESANHLPEPKEIPDWLLEHELQQTETPEWVDIAYDEEMEQASPLFDHFDENSTFALEPEITHSSETALSPLHTEIGNFLDRLDQSIQE